jgi:hypothetical protein
MDPSPMKSSRIRLESLGACDKAAHKLADSKSQIEDYDDPQGTLVAGICSGAGGVRFASTVAHRLSPQRVAAEFCTL